MRVTNSRSKKCDQLFQNDFYTNQEDCHLKELGYWSSKQHPGNHQLLQKPWPEMSYKDMPRVRKRSRKWLILCASFGLQCSNYASKLTFKRGMVTVGAAAITWYPTAWPLANNDWVYGIASIWILLGGWPFLPSTNSAGRPSMTLRKMSVG